MYSIIQRRLGVFVFLLAALVLSGCGSKEPQQRKAFMTFLQTRILDRTSHGTPLMSQKDREDFGPYAAHYQIIANFSLGIDAALKSMNDANSIQSKLTGASGLMNNWQELVKLQQDWPKVDQAVADELKKAQDARAALKQPDDLKAVYDQVFDKLVSRPAQGFQNMSPALVKTLKSLEDMGRFLSDNKSNIRFSGPDAEFQDEATLSKFQALKDHMDKNAADLAQALQQFNSALR
jgi:hypothetical protein